MLYIAEKMKMSLAEVAVNWTEIDGTFFNLVSVIILNNVFIAVGSKIVPVWSWLQMGFDVLEIWFRYRTGSWKIQYKAE